MLNALKQSTAAQAIKTNPIYDLSGSWVTTLAATDFQIAKNGGALTALHSATVTYDAGGCYTITLDATDTDTLGRVVIVCVKASTICRPKEFQVIPAAVYTALVDATTKLPVSLAVADVTGNLPANAKQWDGAALPTAFAANNLPDDYATHEDAAALAAAIATRASQVTADAIKARTDLLGSVTTPVQSPVTEELALELTRGDTYSIATGNAIEFTYSGSASLLGASATLTVRTFRDNPELVLLGAIDGTTVRFEATAAQTGGLTPSPPGQPHKWDYQITLAGGQKITPVIGTCVVKEDQTRT